MMSGRHNGNILWQWWIREAVVQKALLVVWIGWQQRMLTNAVANTGDPRGLEAPSQVLRHQNRPFQTLVEFFFNFIQRKVVCFCIQGRWQQAMWESSFMYRTYYMWCWWSSLSNMKSRSMVIGAAVSAKYVRNGVPPRVQGWMQGMTEATYFWISLYWWSSPD